VNILLHSVLAGLRHHARISPEAINTAEIARRLLLESNGTNSDAADLDDLDDDLLEDSGDDGDPI
jgi:hypothetical protein